MRRTGTIATGLHVVETRNRGTTTAEIGSGTMSGENMVSGTSADVEAEAPTYVWTENGIVTLTGDNDVDVESGVVLGRRTRFFFSEGVRSWPQNHRHRDHGQSDQTSIIRHT